jgi:DNA-binding transcriptional ArsR family regulator
VISLLLGLLREGRRFQRGARLLLSCSMGDRPNSDPSCVDEVSLGMEASMRSAEAGLRPSCVKNACPCRCNASFAALSDATRRGVLEQLARVDASITDLADKFDMTLTGMKKHIGVLEQAGLVTTAKVGRVRTCKIGPYRLEEEMEWIARYRQVWDTRFDALDGVIEELNGKEKFDGRKKRK